MPPRFTSLIRNRPPLPLTSNVSCISTFLLPFLHTPNRKSSILSNLRDNPGAFRRRRRVGRGPSSSKGKTSGRGHKGQKQHGKVPAGFNGGQTPDEVVHGSHGFKNNFAIDLKPLNLSKLTSWISQSRLDPTHPITIKELRESRCISNVKDGVKLLAKGSEELKTPINIIISRASAQAIAAIEAAGGSVTTRYYTNFAIRQICAGKMDPVNSLQSAFPQQDEEGGVKGLSRRRYLYRLPDATSRKDIEYYRDPAHRGYLSHLVPEGQGPSLFFRTPGTGQRVEKGAVKSKDKASENRIW
ncbi:MAG: hypothetical protein Q9164_005032 [Protoblastenia rupestris]